VVGSQITVNFFPDSVAVTPDGSRVYVTNQGDSTVQVIDTATNFLIRNQIGVGALRIGVGSGPRGVAVTPDGSKVYVANQTDGTVSVIDTATNAVVATLPVGREPYAFGLFIQPAKPPFAGTVGQENCAGQSVAAVTRRHGGMLGAARALGYASVEDLQAAIDTYCNG
jgi:YVTN family beta-propeller protein